MPSKADIPWTLRCKVHTITVVVSVPKSTSLNNLKDKILESLNGAYPAGNIETEDGPIPIPDSPDDVELGQLANPSDIHSGWQTIAETEEETIPKGKGKAAAGKAVQNGVAKMTVESVGLKDFALVGIRFRGFGGLVQRSIEDDTEHDDWGIILPQLHAVEDDEDETRLPAGGEVSRPLASNEMYNT